MTRSRRTRRVSCLIVEDDVYACEMLTEHLELAGFATSTVHNGNDALDTMLGDPPDICVLDIDLPGVDGLTVLQKVRSARLDMGVIMLTGRAGDLDRVRGLRMGADDYLGKPFLPAELVARAEALARRMRGQIDQVVHAGDLHLDLGARSVAWRGTAVELTKTEFELLGELASNAGKVVSRAQLLTDVWGLPPEWKADATLTEHIHRLRTKLEGVSISTVRGVGYRFDPDPRS